MKLTEKLKILDIEGVKDIKDTSNAYYTEKRILIICKLLV